jgi:hypothetical protein
MFVPIAQRKPRPLNLRRIAAEYAERDGVDLPEVIWEILLGLINLAKKGDRWAIEEVLDRVSEGDALALHVTHDGEITAKRAEPDARTLAEYLTDLARLPEPTKRLLVERADADLDAGVERLLE